MGIIKWLRYVKGIFDVYIISFVVSALRDLIWSTLSPDTASIVINTIAYSSLLVVVASILLAWCLFIMNADTSAHEQFEDLVASLLTFVIVVFLHERINH